MAKPGDLTRGQVVHIKLCMLKGMGNAELARLYKKSAETMSRIRTGVSHAKVHVFGEEALRAAEFGEEAVVGPGAPEQPGASKAEIDASLERLKKLMAEPEAPAAQEAYSMAGPDEGKRAELEATVAKLMGQRPGKG